MIKKEEKKLGDLLGDALARAGVMGQVAAAVVVNSGDEALEAMFGNGVLEHARCSSFKDGRLVMACTSAALSHEIQNRTSELIDLVTRKVPGATVDDVYITLKSSTGRGAAWYDDSKYAS